MQDYKISRDDVYDHWLAELRQGDPADRYSREDRQKHLETLFNAMKEAAIEKEEVKFLKRKVVEALVTEEGMKDRGKHKGWKKNTETDFDDILTLTYSAAARAEQKSYQMAQTFVEDPNIVKWCKDTFGPDVDMFTIKEAHNPGAGLHWTFLNQFYKRNTGGRL